MGNIVSNIEEIQANIINNKINDNKSVPIQINNQISSTSTYNTPQSINISSQNNINKNTNKSTNNLKTTLSHNSLYSLCSNSSFTNSIVNKCVGNINISNSNNSNNNISNYKNDNLDIDSECDVNVND